MLISSAGESSLVTHQTRTNRKHGGPIIVIESSTCLNVAFSVTY